MKKYIFLFILPLVFSCEKNKNQAEKTINKPQLSIVTKHTAFVPLETISEKKTTHWKEYNSVQNHLKLFSSISANEALNNALELSKLVKHLKDSIRPKELINNSFRTRVNVLENEALRLKDMTFISAITAKEVNAQVDKILEAFSATNSKINSLYAQLEIEKEIKINRNFIDIRTKKTKNSLKNRQQ